MVAGQCVARRRSASRPTLRSSAIDTLGLLVRTIAQAYHHQIFRRNRMAYYLLDI
jgi:hypothetical protein